MRLYSLIMIIMHKRQRKSCNIRLFMGFSWIFSGLKIQVDLVKIIKEVEEEAEWEKEVDQDKINGKEMIDGEEDHRQHKEEARQVIAETKISKISNQSAPETK